ncbi:MAG: hypothetical protein R3D86_00685 [Emcibacteraceae bacterium]
MAVVNIILAILIIVVFFITVAIVLRRLLNGILVLSDKSRFNNWLTTLNSKTDWFVISVLIITIVLSFLLNRNGIFMFENTKVGSDFGGELVSLADDCDSKDLAQLKIGMLKNSLFLASVAFCFLLTHASTYSMHIMKVVLKKFDEYDHSFRRGLIAYPLIICVGIWQSSSMVLDQFSVEDICGRSDIELGDVMSLSVLPQFAGYFIYMLIALPKAYILYFKKTN